MRVGTWECVPFLEAVSDESRGHTRVKQSDYLSEGPLAVVDQGQELVGGFTDAEDAASRVELPAIIFGDHTRAVKFIDFPFAVGADGVKVLKARPGVDSRYLYRYLQTVQLTDGGYSRHFKYLKEIDVPLPPIEKQRRIAAVLDAADALRAKRLEAVAKLDTLTRAIFIDMFGRGRRPPINPGPVHAEHPAGWTWVSLQSLARMATGHTPDRSVPDYWDGDVGWINLNEIRRLDGRWCSGTELTITEAGVANSSAVILPVGTVCFSRTASIGFVTVLAEAMATSQDFVNWVCGDSLHPDYLMHAFLASRDVLRGSSSGSTHRTIYVRDAERFHVLLPPVGLQREFVARLAAVRQARARMQSTRSVHDHLFSSLQQRAFRGDL